MNLPDKNDESELNFGDEYALKITMVESDENDGKLYWVFSSNFIEV